MQGQDIHARDHLIQTLVIPRAVLLFDAWIQTAAIVIGNLHTKGPSAQCDRAANAPHSDNADPLACNPAAQHLHWRPAAPCAAAHTVQPLGNAAGDGHDQRHRHIGRVIG